MVAGAPRPSPPADLIPEVFRVILEERVPVFSVGLERSLRLPPVALEYFQLHINLDVEHGKVLQESLLRWATTEENQEDIRRGARRSLEARAAFWSALGEQLFPNLSSVATG